MPKGKEGFDEGRSFVVAVQAALARFSEKLEQEAKQQAELLAEPELKKALEESKLSERVDKVRAEGDERAKQAKVLHEQAKKAAEKMLEQIDALDKLGGDPRRK